MDFEDDNNLDFQQNNANIEDEIYVNTDYKTMNDAVIFLVDLQISDSNIFNQIFNITENSSGFVTDSIELLVNVTDHYKMGNVIVNVSSLITLFWC